MNPRSIYEQTYFIQIKVGLPLSKKKIIWFTEYPLKVMKNAF